MRLLQLSSYVLLVQITIVAVSHAQTAATHTLKVESKVVEVSAIVRGKSGEPVTGLTHDDFVLTDDGKAQQIDFFSQGSELPLTLALMVDTSGSEDDYVREEIAAAREFFPSVLKKPADRAALVQFDERVRQLASMTNSIGDLEKGLTYLADSHPNETHLYDAICAASGYEFGGRTGRKVMVILTDGVDDHSQCTIAQAADAAQRADVMIYSIFYGRDGDIEGLNYLSNTTGGRALTVSAKMTLRRIYEEIANDMSLVYELGYNLPDSRPTKFHKIKLRMKDKDLTIQTREGYYSLK